MDAGARPIHVLHDAATLATLIGDVPSSCDGLVLAVPPTSPPIAAVVGGNPLADDWLLDLELPSSRVVLWSGTLAEGLFDDDPRTWMRSGHDAFRRFCDAAAPTLVARGMTLAFRPHARHILSDVQGCLDFLRGREGQPFELALAPADLLTAEMLPAAEDHLIRIYETLGPRAALVLLTDRAAAAGESPRPVRDGTPHADLVRRLLRTCVPATTPLVLLPERLAEQRDWLARPAPEFSASDPAVRGGRAG